MKLLNEVLALWFLGDFVGSLNAMEQGMELAESSGIKFYKMRFLLQGVYSCLGRDDVDTADKYLKLIVPYIRDTDLFNKGLYCHLAAMAACQKGDFTSALLLNNESLRCTAKGCIPFGKAMDHIGQGQILTSLGRYGEAELHLKTARRTGALMRSRALEVNYLMYGANLEFCRGEDKTGYDLLAQALALGRKEGFFHLHWWNSQVLINLCCRALHADIETDYVQKFIQKHRFSPQIPPVSLEKWPWTIKIRTLGSFSLLVNEEHLQTSRKAQKKPIEMLKALIAMGGTEVREQKISSALWPKADGHARHMLFKTTLHRLRKLLAGNRAIIQHEGRLTLDKRHCWVDAWAFDQLLEKADQQLIKIEKTDSLPDPEIVAEAESLAEKALALYQGPFLAADGQEPWTVSFRQRLKAKYIFLIHRLANLWERTGEYEKVVNCCQSALQADELAEELYRHLMVCFIKQGRKAEAVKTYHRCCSNLKVNLFVEPSPETKALFREIMQ